jgi:hypothetical protein
MDIPKKGVSMVIEYRALQKARSGSEEEETGLLFFLFQLFI